MSQQSHNELEGEKAIESNKNNIQNIQITTKTIMKSFTKSNKIFPSIMINKTCTCAHQHKDQEGGE
jgi:hypothetical protein